MNTFNIKDFFILLTSYLSKKEELQEKFEIYNYIFQIYIEKEEYENIVKIIIELNFLTEEELIYYILKYLNKNKIKNFYFLNDKEILDNTTIDKDYVKHFSIYDKALKIKIEEKYIKNLSNNLNEENIKKNDYIKNLGKKFYIIDIFVFLEKLKTEQIKDYTNKKIYFVKNNFYLRYKQIYIEKFLINKFQNLQKYTLNEKTNNEKLISDIAESVIYYTLFIKNNLYIECNYDFNYGIIRSYDEQFNNILIVNINVFKEIKRFFKNETKTKNLLENIEIALELREKIKLNIDFSSDNEFKLYIENTDVLINKILDENVLLFPKDIKYISNIFKINNYSINISGKIENIKLLIYLLIINEIKNNYSNNRIYSDLKILNIWKTKNFNIDNSLFIFKNDLSNKSIENLELLKNLHKKIITYNNYYLTNSEFLRKLDEIINRKKISELYNILISIKKIKILCPKCKKLVDEKLLEENKIIGEKYKEFGLFGIDTSYIKNGCELCNFSGYLEEKYILDFIYFDKNFINEFINNNRNVEEIIEKLKEFNYQGFQEKLEELLKEGLIDIYELEKHINIFDINEFTY